MKTPRKTKMCAACGLPRATLAVVEGKFVLHYHAKCMRPKKV